MFDIVDLVKMKIYLKKKTVNARQDKEIQKSRFTTFEVVLHVNFILYDSIHNAVLPYFVKDTGGFI